jgi:hypothetical protein
MDLTPTLKDELPHVSHVQVLWPMFFGFLSRLQQ